MQSLQDFVIVGGGVAGLSTALRLADQGASVTVLDRQETGKEASWAGAGMLPPGNPEVDLNPEQRLRAHSHQLWAEFAADLSERTGIDTGYRVCGAIQVQYSEHSSLLDQCVDSWTREGIRYDILGREDAQSLVPGLSSEMSAVHVPDFAQIRNPRYLRALKTACRQRNVQIQEHVEHLTLQTAGDRITEVRIPGQSFCFDSVCIAAGAWSSSILTSLGISIPVKPIRGQIVQLQLKETPFRCVVELGRRYIVPRDDGLVLIGSTEEDAGFVKENTPDGISMLLRFAASVIPALPISQVCRTWAGLRPGTPDELPLIGAVPRFSNLFIGTGYFRSGLQMSPGAGMILSDLMRRVPPPVSLDGLTVDRFQSPNHS